MHRFVFGASLVASVVVAGAVVGGGGVAAAGAARTATSILVHTAFGGSSPFESTLAGCASGLASDGRGHVQFNRAHNVFNGAKVFDCAGAAGGFTVQLNATFSDDGSTGTWAIVDGWGSQAGLKGQGTLVGTITDAGIDDLYTGWTSG